MFTAIIIGIIIALDSYPDVSGGMFQFLLVELSPLQQSKAFNPNCFNRLKEVLPNELREGIVQIE